jgi:hypothetical protein
MDILEFLKYIGIGITALIAFFIALAIIGGMLSLLLDIVVFIIIAPFYILFHPIMFITKPKMCFKNILMKTPGIGEDMEYAELSKNYKPRKITKIDLIVEKETQELLEIDRFYKDCYGTDVWGNKVK